MFAQVATPRVRLTPVRSSLRPVVRPPKRLRCSLVRCGARPGPAPSIAARLSERERVERAVVWDALDLASVAGTVTGAALVILGYDVLFATLPIGLPILSLCIGIQRERRRVKARDVMDEMIIDDIERQRLALENVQNKIGGMATKIDALLNGKVLTFEAKLDRIEATMISTSKNVKEVSGGLKSLPGIMKRISELQQQTVIYAVSGEFRSLFEKWGSAQLQSINDVSERLKFVEESIDRLGAYDLRPGAASSYDLPGPSTIDVAAERKETSRKSASILNDVKDVIQREIASVLKQLKDNQVDMMQSLRDVKVNPIPQADYENFEAQLKRIEEVLGGLPQQLGETFKTEAEGIDLKFNAVSAVVRNLEIAIEELKKAAMGREPSLELEALEKKWLELRGLMNRLGAHLTGVNDRMDKIIHPSATSFEDEVMEAEEEKEEVMTEMVYPEQEASAAEEEYLEFQDTADITVPAVAPVTASNGASDREKEWDVVDSMEEAAFAEAIHETDDDAFEEEEEAEDVTPAENGTYVEEIESSEPQTASQDVSKIGNAKIGLELLKKGRLALADDYGEASRYLVDALAEFNSILEVDPTNVQCLGNCGNTLLALGELKFRMAKDAEPTEDASSDSKNASQELKQEAQEFLTLAGRRFRELLETNSEDKRAYMNWAKALCMRARLTAEVSLKMQLYDAAIVKYEQILSFDQESAEAMYFCGVALKESSQVPMGSPMELRNRLNQAVVYFEVPPPLLTDAVPRQGMCVMQSVSRVAPSSPLQFEAFQMIQECRQLAGSPALI